MIKAKSLATAVLATASALVLAAGPALAATAIQYTPILLTQAELDTNWMADRTTPSGGYGSVTFAERTDVLEIRVASENASATEGFNRTEGLKRSVTDVDALRVDLYIDPEWISSDVPVRAGLWGVGNDSTGAIAAYPIIEFTTRGVDGFVGWRSWDGVNGGWTNHPNLPYLPGKWATLEIFHSPDSSEFGLTINSLPAISNAAGGAVTFSAVILNQYNYAGGGTDYATHWSQFATGQLLNFAGSKADCSDGGWAGYGFKNQGQCIASLVAADGATG